MFEQKLLDYQVLLKKHFDEEWQTILCLAYGRLLYLSPLKNMAFYYHHSYFSELFKEVNLSAKFLGTFLRNLGIKRKNMVTFFREFRKAQECILFDGTDMISNSKEMNLSKKGRCKQGSYESLTNLMFVYSVEQQLPIYYRITPGNIRDIKSFKLSLEESQIRDATIIIDKGFYSKANIKLIKSEGLQFIIPLKRNSSMIQYGKNETGGKGNYDGYFKFENRYIWYNTRTVAGDKLYLFLDEELRVKEEKDYLERIDAGTAHYTIEKFKAKQPQFGTIAMLSNSDKAPASIYTNYKSRGNIEQMIDVLKNVVEADVSYMQNEQALEGWMFINYIALHWYYKIYHLLAKHNLNSKYSPMEIIRFLIEVKKVKINDTWHLAEITKKTKETLDKLELPIT